jgi:hypothetical protein
VCFALVVLLTGYNGGLPDTSHSIQREKMVAGAGISLQAAAVASTCEHISGSGSEPVIQQLAGNVRTHPSWLHWHLSGSQRFVSQLAGLWFPAHLGYALTFSLLLLSCPARSRASMSAQPREQQDTCWELLVLLRLHSPS